MRLLSTANPGPRNSVDAVGNYLDTYEFKILFAGGTHSDGLSDFRFSPDGKLLGAAFSDGRIEIWNVHEGKCQSSIKIED
ncbi:MAG TPA: hypothetical protein VKE70_31110, partial [Candidatus Solibacter sp.]|nr:hypothetical protein [Candidatus Solibacter sp.]